MACLSTNIGIICIFLTLIASSFGVFQFKRYSYRKKSGNERRYRLEEERCHNVDECQLKKGLDKEKCVRTCVSKQCYDELYSWNELEEGEIDVRLTSFKGCVVQQIRDHEMQQRRKEQL
ncbi:uncharacterized protein LOC114526423 [Dendronephthya gigantea]|uniref:uncharacterized protein LOC114526423 n=1 Tax=Dendronephthya gigantea TaxID=151771 RepID=UPI00106C160A|nr:uncharacterized protein LOC114526423 [Dendronephthya gigantea]